MKKPRCMQIFEQSCRSEVTKEVYTGRLEAFMRFHGITDPEILTTLDHKVLQRYVEDCNISQKKT